MLAQKNRGAGGAFVHPPTDRSGPRGPSQCAREASTYLRSVPCGSRTVRRNEPGPQGRSMQTGCSLREIVRGQLTTVRPATDDDVGRLVARHADPDVSRFWDDET